jgi:hypothetical protein
MSAAASGLGGFLAGRLRQKWLEVDADEAFFRDTAHGLLAWAVATLFSAAVLTSAASSMAGAAVKAAGLGAATAGATAAAGAATAATGAAPATNTSDTSRDYFVDMMFRGSKSGVEGGSEVPRREAGLILTNALNGELSQGDRAYLTQVVAARTGLSPTEAEQRVTQTTAAAKATAEAAEVKAKEAANTARKAAATTALWIFVSLLLGAFCAALAATWGGKVHDIRAYRRQPV